MLGLLIVSHSEDAARGIAQIAAQMAGENVVILGVGGDDEGGLGVSVMKIFDALSQLLTRAGSILVIPDMGSSVLSSCSAVEMLAPDDAANVVIVDAPILEGAVLAAVEASCGAPLEQVIETAKAARNLEKMNR